MDNLINKYNVGNRVLERSIVSHMAEGVIQHVDKSHRSFVYIVKWDDGTQTEMKEKDLWVDNQPIVSNADSDSEDESNDSDNNDDEDEEDDDIEEEVADAAFIASVLNDAAHNVNVAELNDAVEALQVNDAPVRALNAGRGRGNLLRVPAVLRDNGENEAEPAEVNLLRPNDQEWTPQANINTDINTEQESTCHYHLKTPENLEQSRQSNGGLSLGLIGQLLSTLPMMN